MRKAASLFEFGWPVSITGYECQNLLLPLSHLKVQAGKTADPPVRCLVRKAGECGERVTHPLRASRGLFREFAELRVEEEWIENDVVSFASDFGMLGGPVERGYESIPSAGSPTYIFSAESLSSWRQEVLEMRGLLELADAACAKPTPNFGLLKQHVAWHKEWIPQETRNHGGREFNSIVSVRLSPESDATVMEVPTQLESVIPVGDLTYPVLHVVQAKINEKLNQLRVVPRLAWSVDGKQLQIQIYPPSLLAAIWVQAFTMVGGQTEFRRCEGCNKWREIGNEPGQFRADQSACDDTCRKRIQRKRKADAKRLGKEGYSIEDIASRTGSKKTTIQRWLEEIP